MSLRTELQELVEWVSDLSAPERQKPPPQPLWRETWQDVADDLDRASETFGKARTALHGNDPSYLAEIAEDLEHEAENLAFRAHLLSRRAQPKPQPPPKPAVVKPAAPVATGDKEKSHATTAAGPPERREEKPDDRPPAALVKSAGDTVETAHRKLLSVDHPDAVTQAFEDDLDVLAEMTLSLRQQCARVEQETG